jgi:hypothetical protein
MRIVIIVAAIAAAVTTLGQLPEAERIRWVDRDGFVGIVFRADGARCRAGVFGDDADLSGAVCTGGDPWAR